MSFVSFAVWQIRLVRESDFKHALIGFQIESERSLLEADTPFKFYERLKEAQIFRFFKLIACENQEIGEFAKFVKRRNKIAHPSGTVFFNDRESIDAEIGLMMREVDNIQKHMRPIIQEVYGRFLVESSHLEEREFADPRDEIEANLIHQSYMSQKDLVRAAYDLGQLSSHPNFAATQALHQTLRAMYVEAVGEPAPTP